MIEFWRGITEGQGSVIASFLTVVAAGLGVVLGSRLFGGRVMDLKEALSQSQDALREHESSVDIKLAEIFDKIKLMEEDIIRTLEKISRVSGDISTTQASEEGANNTSPVLPIDSIRDDWSKIREKLEDIVSDPSIDGRTRAKFARIDRRQYGYLIDTYHNDRGLPQVTKFRRALQLWQKYKGGRTTPSEAEVSEMSNLRSDLTEG